MLPKPVEIALLAATLHSIARRVLSAADNSAGRRHWRLDADGWCLNSPSGRSAELSATEPRVRCGWCPRREGSSAAGN